MDILDLAWDKQWAKDDAYAEWFKDIAEKSARKLKPQGSFIFFGGLGSENSRPFWKACMALDAMETLHYRDQVCWKKIRAYGKKFSYLYCREEIAWYSRSPVRTEVTFNIPYLSEKRGYAGFNPRYPCKSEFKRVSNVWSDINELMRPKRPAEKPVPLMERLVTTHSNPGDLIVDPFTGIGPTAVAALKHGRRFVGCDLDKVAVERANQRCDPSCLK
jgi:DNA modification methylase